MYKRISEIQFPEHNNININMMPFIFGDDESLPEEYRNYSKMIDCVNYGD